MAMDIPKPLALVPILLRLRRSLTDTLIMTFRAPDTTVAVPCGVYRNGTVAVTMAHPANRVVMRINEATENSAVLSVLLHMSRPRVKYSCFLQRYGMLLPPTGTSFHIIIPRGRRFFALRYLDPLLRRGKYPGGGSVNARIRTDKSTLITIQEEVGCACNLDLTKRELA